MSLNSNDTASILYNKILEVYENNEIVFIDFLNSTLDNAFQNASTNYNNFKLDDASGTLNITADNNVIKPESLASSVSEYWSKAITKGTPESCNNIDDVTNNADDIKDSIINGLKNLYINSANGIASNPPFYEFVDIIFSAVKDIEWTITESDSDCSATFTGSVS